MTSHYLIPLNAHPLLYCTFMFAIGITAQSSGHSFCAYIIYALIIIVLISLSYKHKKLVYAACALSFIGGALNYQRQMTTHVQLNNLINNNEFEVIGHVSSITTLKNQRMAQSITITTEQIKISSIIGAWVKTEKTIQLYTTQKTALMVADRVHIKNLAIKTAKNNSYSFYLIKEQIDASLFAPSVQYTILERPKHSVGRLIFSLRNRILFQAQKKLNPQAFALFASIFLGNRVDSKKAMAEPKESYKIWGISHYLARSGLHLVIVVFVWDFLLNFLPISFLFKQIAMLFLAIFYCFCSWSSISFLRAFAVFILYKACLITRLPINVLHLLSIVTLGVLIFNPAQLFFLDFQLSFGLTYALAWFNHIYKSKHG